MSSATSIKCRSVLMVGTHPTTMGGIASVVRGYMEGGLFDRWPVRYVATHRDGSRLHKLWTWVSSYFRVLGALLFLPRPLLHIHLSHRASFWRKAGVCALARLFRRPYLLHLHGSEFMAFYEQECGRRARRIVESTFGRAAVVLALSEEWRSNILGICPSAVIEVLPNAVRIPDSAADRCPRTGLGRILFLGRLGQRKGTFDLVRAFSMLANRFPESHLVCAGDGSVDAVRHQAVETGLDLRVECPGWLSVDQARGELARADVFVLPSYAEGLPMSLLEAMASGLPVIASRVGGIPSLVQNGVNGLLIDAGNPAALAGAIESVLADAALRARLGAGARQTIVERYSLESHLARLGHLYGRFGIIPDIDGHRASRACS